MAMVRYFTSTRPAIGIRIDGAGYRYPRRCFGRIIGHAQAIRSSVLKWKLAIPIYPLNAQTFR
jgi:hypothetical protein